jgi:hypothetical protein
MNTEFEIPAEVSKHPAWYRLQNQHKWYSKESAKNKKYYHFIKLCQIMLAGLIPFITLINYSGMKYIIALFGAIIAALEGIQHLFQFHTLWFEYRSTTEQLKHEKYLFLAMSGPYRDLNEEEGLRLLAERIEEHISKEHAKWIDTSKKAASDATKKINNP